MKSFYSFFSLGLLNSFFIVTVLFISVLFNNSTAQTLDVIFFDADGDGSAFAMQDCNPPIGIVVDDKDHLTVPWVAGGTTWYGVPYDYISALSYGARVSSCGTVRARVSSHCYVGGDGTKTMVIDWYNWASAYCKIDAIYHAKAVANYWFDITIQIMPGGGYNIGDSIELFFQHHFSGAGITKHNAVNEDPVSTINTCNFNGNSLIGNDYNFSIPPGLTGWRRETTNGSMMVAVGNIFTIDMTSLNSAEINPPPKNNTTDRTQSKFRGIITLSLDSIPPPPQLQPNYYPRIEFSLDIGSDAELSDPNQNGNEVFDPGDAYLMRGTFMTTPQNGVRNDSDIFGYDPSPVPGDPTTNVPCGLGIFDPLPYFNLNGMDNMQTSLFGLTYGPGYFSIPYFTDSLVFLAQYLLLSYDDDGPENWSYNSFGLQSVPVNSQSPMAFDTYGKTSTANEVIAIDMDPYNVPSFPFTIDSLWSEADIHPNMAPNPDLGEEQDNDVNALNYFPNQSIVGIFYFTASSEATHVNPATGDPLNPGSIYQLISPGNFIEVVNPVIHLGLADGVDINAFSFGWVYDSLQARLGLALLFSVDIDDWTTPQDESGGLDPSMIYYSFLDGTHHEFSEASLMDNIDALTIVPHSFNAYLLPTPPPPTCDGPTSLTVTVTSTEAILDWIESVPAPLLGYEIELIDQNGVTILTDVMPAGTSSYAIAGLDPNATYSTILRSLCAGGLIDETAISFTTNLLSDLHLDNLIFPNGFDDCYEAQQNIVLSDSKVENGAKLSLVASGSISLLAETTIESGAEFVAKIDLTGLYCSNIKSVINIVEATSEPEKPVEFIGNAANFRIYPNPTTGQFTLELLDSDLESGITVEIFNIIGERITSHELSAAKSHTFDLSGHKPGIYFIRVMMGGEIAMEKLIKH